MKISNFLIPKAVTADLKAKTKKDVISELADLLIQSGTVEKKQRAKLIEVLMAREALGSTAIGQGIAIPHAKFEGVDKLIGALGVSREGVDFDSLDGEPAYIFFLLVAPVDSAGPHLKALARISRLLKDKFVRENLRSAPDAKAILKLIDQEDQQVA